MNEIEAKELAEKLARGESLRIIDVREDAEVVLGKIPGAIHLPLGQIPERLAELNEDEHYYIVCASGQRSGNACQFLTQHDYHATNVADGMNNWQGKVE